jgi:hypothetical protein
MENPLPVHPNNSLHEMVYKHDEDLYRGNPPGTGLTTRMAIVENELDKLAKNANKLLIAAVTTLLTVVGQIIYKMVFH